MIEIFTDGSSLGNHCQGVFAAILKFGTTEKILKVGEPNTTNNRMEMRAVIEALKTIKKHDIPITVYSDSSLVIRTMTDGWKKKMNLDLWAELADVSGGLTITWKWVRGHAGHPENTRVDKLAVGEAKKQKKSL
ncbi:MAG: ribonuclease H [Patescibacteria group bacterium]